MRLERAADMTGRDIQNMIDDAVNHGEQEVHIPAGVFHADRPIVVGKKDDYSTLRIVGAGPRYNYDARFGGTSVVADFDDRELWLFQGARGSSLRSLSSYGPYWQGLFDRPIPGPNIADWPGRHVPLNPSAGVAIDRGLPYSERVTLDNVEIGGFEVAVITKPDGGDFNGDFVTVRRSRLLYNAVTAAPTHTQARNLRVDECLILFTHTFLDNTSYGMQRGEVDGRITGCSFNTMWNLAKINQAWAGPVSFTDCTGELIGSLGDFTSGGARAATRTVFRDCRFDLRMGEPGLISRGGSILLDGGIFTTADIAVADSVVECRGVKWRPGKYEG